MTHIRRLRSVSPLAAFTILLVVPGLAIQGGLLPFELRFQALLLVAFACIFVCVLSGYSHADLGLGCGAVSLRHWLGCAAITALLATLVIFQAHVSGATHDPPNWAAFTPFYLLVSAPCQEVVCRSIPKLMTDRLGAGGPTYIVYSAAIFALIHLAYGDVLLLVSTFVAGLAWASAYHVTGNLWPLIVSHGTIGMLAFALGAA